MHQVLRPPTPTPHIFISTQPVLNTFDEDTLLKYHQIFLVQFTTIKEGNSIKGKMRKQKVVYPDNPLLALRL